MGFYINSDTKGNPLPTTGKAQALVAAGDATLLLEQPKAWMPNLVCCVVNGFFDGVGFCYSEQEFKVFADSRDRRQKIWLIVPKAAELSGFFSE